MINRLKDFLIKLLGGYKIVVGYFDFYNQEYQSRMINVYPFKKHRIVISGRVLIFDNDGSVEIKEIKTKK